MLSLHLLPHTESIDGIQRAVLDLSRGLGDAGERPTVLALRHGNNTAAWRDVAEVQAPLPFLICSPAKPVAALRMARYARVTPAKFDVVVVHRLDLLNAGAIVARRGARPLVLHAHNSPPPWLRWNDALRVPGARRAGAIIVASEFIAREWRDVAKGVPVRVVALPIDTEHFRYATAAMREQARAKAGAVPGEFVVGFVGRIEGDKGLHVLMAAAHRVHAGGSRVRVVVQGAPGLGVTHDDAALYRRRCVEALGPCPVTWVAAGPDVRDTLAASDVCVVPSIWPEPSGLVVSEALAMGTPVIASDVGGIPEQIPAVRHAQLVGADDPEQLSQALEGLRLDPPSERERQKLRAYVVETRLLASITAHYRAALTGEPRDRSP